MSSSLAASSEASPTILVTSPEQQVAPLFKAIPYVKTALSFFITAIQSAFRHARQISATLASSSPIHPVPIILYVVAPLTVFLSYVAWIFVLGPYATIVWLLEALHPLYVFCGVACLTGLVLGGVARYLATVLVESLKNERGLEEEDEAQEEQDEKVPKEDESDNEDA